MALAHLGAHAGNFALTGQFMWRGPEFSFGAPYFARDFADFARADVDLPRDPRISRPSCRRSVREGPFNKEGRRVPRAPRLEQRRRRMSTLAKRRRPRRDRDRPRQMRSGHTPPPLRATSRPASPTRPGCHGYARRGPSHGKRGAEHGRGDGAHALPGARPRSEHPCPRTSRLAPLADRRCSPCRLIGPRPTRLAAGPSTPGPRAAP